jgi:hypothetical protein
MLLEGMAQNGNMLQTIPFNLTSSVSHTAQKWDEFLNVCYAVGTA